MLAMLVAGYMARQPDAKNTAEPTSGGLGGLLGGLLGGQSAGGGTPGGASTGFASMLDMNGDGNPLDDILRMAGRAFR